MQRLAILFAACILFAAWAARSRTHLVAIDSTRVVSNESAAANSDAQAEEPEQSFLHGEQYGTDEHYEGYWSQPNAAELPEVVLLSRGNRAYRAGDPAAALEAWRDVIARHPNTPAWNMAILNAGGALQKCGRHAEAIATLSRLLNDTANYQKTNEANWLKADSENATPMDTYLDLWNNDWHQACRSISDSFEALDDLESAQHYALMAQHRFSYRATCGTAAAYEWASLDGRISGLARKLNARLEMVFAVLTVAAAALVVWLAVHFINRRQWRRAFGSALAAAAVLVAYPVSFGPASWIAAGSPVCTRFVSAVYFPILRCANRSREAADIAKWYARLGGPDQSIPAFDGDELTWWETERVPPESDDLAESGPPSDETVADNETTPSTAP